MAAESGTRPKTSFDVVIYIVYLVSFLALLYASTSPFGGNLLTLAFGGFVIGAITIVASGPRRS